MNKIKLISMLIGIFLMGSCLDIKPRPAVNAVFTAIVTNNPKAMEMFEELKIREKEQVYIHLIDTAIIGKIKFSDLLKIFPLLLKNKKYGDLIGDLKEIKSIHNIDDMISSVTGLLLNVQSRLHPDNLPLMNSLVKKRGGVWALQGMAKRQLEKDKGFRFNR